MTTALRNQPRLESRACGRPLPASGFGGPQIHLLTIRVRPSITFPFPFRHSSDGRISTDMTLYSSMDDLPSSRFIIVKTSET